MDGMKIDESLIPKIIGIVVAVIVVAVALIPITEEVTETSDTFTNEGYWRMKEISNNDTWEYDGSNSDNPWSYNEEPQDIARRSVNALLGPDWCVRSNGQARGQSISGNASTITATSDGIIITFEGTGGNSEQLLPGYGVDKNGSFIMKRGTNNVYVLDDSVLFGTGLTTVDSVDFVVHVEGNVKDGATFTAYSNRNGTTISNVEFTNISVNAEKISGYVNLYSFSSITANITFDTIVDDTTVSHSGEVTYNGIITPREVTAEKAIHADAMTNTIISIIPIFVVLAILMGIVGLMYFNRNGQ